MNVRRSPDLRHIPSELDSCADTLAQDLAGWTIERFLRACQEHRQHSNYIPTTRDLRQADAAIRPPAAEPIPLPPGESEIAAQQATNRRWLDKWFEQVGRDKRIPA
jgi:hypothetical protein